MKQTQSAEVQPPSYLLTDHWRTQSCAILQKMAAWQRPADCTVSERWAAPAQGHRFVRWRPAAAAEHRQAGNDFLAALYYHV